MSAEVKLQVHPSTGLRVSGFDGEPDQRGSIPRLDADVGVPFEDRTEVPLMLSRVEA